MTVVSLPTEPDGFPPRLSARSVVLSLLLGSGPEGIPGARLVAAAAEMGIAEQTARVALSRMVSVGDLLRADGAYTLSSRLRERQRRQEKAIHPRIRPWSGEWVTVVVVATGRSAADRADLRTTLSRMRMAELREGVWLRPDNLPEAALESLPDRGLDDTVVRRLHAHPVDPVALAAELWDLSGWARTADELLELAESAPEPGARLAVMAAVVRHMLADPMLPDELLPTVWPGDRLRIAYERYRHELTIGVLGLRQPSRH